MCSSSVLLDKFFAELVTVINGSFSISVKSQKLCMPVSVDRRRHNSTRNRFYFRLELDDGARRSELDDGARRSELDDGAQFWSSQNESRSLFACTLAYAVYRNLDRAAINNGIFAEHIKHTHSNDKSNPLFSLV
jgi:hypothetical protein